MPDRSSSGRRPPLTKYYRGGNGGSTSPFQKKIPSRPWKAKFFKLFDVVLLVAVLLGLLLSLVVKPNPKVIVSSNAYHGTLDYQAVASQSMDNFKDKNKLTFSEAPVASRLQAKFPEISNIGIELPIFGQNPVVRLDISSPKVRLLSQSQTYVVDEQGIVTGLAAQVPNSQKLPALVDQSGFKVTVGKAVLSRASVDFINQLLSQCHKSNVPVRQLVLPSAAQELDLYTSDQPYYVKFFLGDNASLQIGQFLAARHKFAAGGPLPSTYLDVRVPGKVYFK